MLTLIFGIWASEPPPRACRTTEKAGPDRVKRYILIKHLKNGISFKSNTKRFAEFTNCNLSQKLFKLTLLLFDDVQEHQFPSYCIPRPTSIWGKDFSLQSPEFYSCIQFEIRKKDWPVDFAKL